MSSPSFRWTSWADMEEEERGAEFYIATTTSNLVNPVEDAEISPTSMREQSDAYESPYTSTDSDSSEEAGEAIRLPKLQPSEHPEEFSWLKPAPYVFDRQDRAQTLSDDDDIHHYSFARNPITHHSATPAEVSFWATETLRRGGITVPPSPIVFSMDDGHGIPIVNDDGRHHPSQVVARPYKRSLLAVTSLYDGEGDTSDDDRLFLLEDSDSSGSTMSPDEVHNAGSVLGTEQSGLAEGTVRALTSFAQRYILQSGELGDDCSDTTMQPCNLPSGSSSEEPMGNAESEAEDVEMADDDSIPCMLL
ncbi:hypothetical protein MMC25_005935 [Agyrium rufum]|nr:hypothetical protein [Agyrium rufum]